MKKALALALTALAYSSTAYAEATRFYNLEGFGSFLDGNPESTAVTEDGLITLPPIAKERFSDAAASFTAATAQGDDVIVAKAGSNVVMAIDKNGKTRDLATLEGGVVTALLAHDGDIYAAVGPSAKIYKLNGKGKADVWCKPESSFVWAMTPAPSGGLYIAAGDPGKVYKVDKGGKATELWASDQQHLRSIAYAKDMGIFVGGGERGILFKSNGEKDFRALFDSGHPEITSIIARDGFAYVAAVSGADALASDDGDSGGGRKGKGPQVRSQLVRVSMTGASETLAGSNDEGIFALAFDASGNVLVATGAAGRDDPRGRLYSVAPSNREISMVYQAKSRRITHLVDVGHGSVAAVASAGGRVIQVTGPAAQTGEFFTVAYDAGINASFGVVQLFGNVPHGTTATVAVRTGQTATPDAAWSAWSKEVPYPGGIKADVPNGRFVQLRLTLGSSGKESPRINRLRIAYLRQNLRPFVREVVALRKGVALIAQPREEQKSKTVSLAEKATEEMRRGDNPQSTAATRARQIEQRGALTVRWVAEDPNGDELKYDLEFRSEGKDEWRTLNKDLEEPFYTVQSAQLPDGHYQFRVRATDEPSNPHGAELEDKRESTSVLVDNSPPRVARVLTSVDGKKVTAKVDVADNVGPIVGAEYAVDGGTFKPMAPADGVLDGAAETFEVKLQDLDKGSHTFTVRVIDEAENEGFGESSFQIR